MGKNITIILGHPDSASYCAAIANEYARSAEESGHNVRLFRLGELTFDPSLHYGYNQRQPLEPDLVAVQDAISWAHHLVFVYPIWWGSMPPLLKGLFDRVLLPGYAFKYREKSQFWDRLLAGRSAHVIVTMDTPPWYYRLVYHSPGHYQIKKTILEFCGIKPVKITSFGPIRYSTHEKRVEWLNKVARFAKSLPEVSS